MAIENLITDHLDLWTAAVRPKSSAGRGSNSKRELTGIKKLRELILELAVRGKLVPQDPSDEPASVLLERIATEKTRLVKEKKIKKSKALPEIGEEEKLFELPDGWEWCRLSDIAFPQAGFAFKSNGFNEHGEGIPLIRIRDVGQVFSGTYYNGEYKPEFVVMSGEYLISMDGNFRVAPWSGSEALLNQRVTRLMFFFEKTAKRFIAESLQLRLISLQGVKAYTTVDHLSGGQIAESVIAIPPLAEQHRIVAKVDDLMALCDQLELRSESQLAAHQTLVETLLATLTDSCDADELAQNWARLSTHFDTLFTTERSIDSLKQNILQLAVMGKLVQQDPSDEPAAALLERIAAEKAQLVKEKKIKKEKPLPAISEDEKPFELPKGWEWCRLPDLGELARGKSKHRPRNDPKLYVNGTIPLVQTGDVARADCLIESYTAMYNEIGLAQSQLWPKGTLCITIAANIADTGILGFDACFPDSVVGYTPYEPSLPVVYFDFFIRTAKENLERFAPSTAQKNINLEILSNILVPCPPTQEFIRIVSRVNDLFAICDQLKSRLQTSQQTQLALAESLVEGALA
ncbi:restriction endonuclease subunit S [Aeromonas hydrophila]|uniref:restriction endonuclease subunit S n=1 Tax=Aeromonas hydrophila TaxID=644 RepID=UPI000332B7B9|nr:restriction endonuclease subunit S [Aeromonas hydrophila]AGM43346.1 restriction modification system DNA specificity subunit [Aeromonas hydrophila ML09-119]AHX32037.1 restriction endonuclease [Aeromonas hydrophila subsp. hydrophila AL09-71]AHX68835.1 restriction endonuclease [Aeromonas hydrophila pc104A]AJE37168.1 restriction endonuclease [Aeromonas hydrophila J-1]AKJ35430.1 restriction endonuclease [Aeromonas hydrophila NJ-35]